VRHAPLVKKNCESILMRVKLRSDSHKLPRYSVAIFILFVVTLVIYMLLPMLIDLDGAGNTKSIRESIVWQHIAKPAQYMYNGAGLRNVS